MPTSSPRTMPGLGLKSFFGAGTDGWDGDMDTNLRLLSVLCQGRVLSRVASVPGSPTNGDIHIVTTGAEAQKIAVRENGAWVYIPVFEGFRMYDDAVNRYVYYNGTAWVDEGAIGSTRALLQTLTASNSATLDFTAGIDTAYAEYEIRLFDIKPVNSAVALNLRTSPDAGASWDSGASDYRHSGRYNSSGSSATIAINGDGSSAQLVTAISNSAAHGVNGHILLTKPNTASLWRPIRSEISAVASTGESMDHDVTVHRMTTAGVNGIRLFMSGGNIASGVAELWGIK